MLYKRLKQKEKELKELISLGVVAPFWITYIQIFEDFNSQPELSKESRYYKLSEKYGYKSSSSIKKIIKRLNS